MRNIFAKIRSSDGWNFFRVLGKADRGLAFAWWSMLVLRGLLPALFAVAMGVLVGAVEHGGSLAGPLFLVGAVFVLLQVLSPLHQAVGTNLGSRTAAWLYDELTTACVRLPGMGHLEDRLTDRPDHVARFRFGHQRSAPVYLDGVHCVGTGRNGRRHRLGVRFVCVCLVGGHCVSRRMVGDSLSLAGERVGGIAIPTST